MTAAWILAGLSVLLFAMAIRQAVRSRITRRAAAATHLESLRSPPQPTLLRPGHPPLGQLVRIPKSAASTEMPALSSEVYEDDPLEADPLLRPVDNVPGQGVPYGGLSGLGPVGALGGFSPDASINGPDPSSDNLYGA
jgi:hypothetical protein